MLHHVSIEVMPGDVERTLEFWETLGFERLAEPEDLGGYVSWLERDSTQIHLIHTPKPAVPALGHAAVIAPEFEATVEALRGAGFEVSDARELWGEPRAFAIAPGGHRVELMRAPPAPGGRRGRG